MALDRAVSVALGYTVSTIVDGPWAMLVDKKIFVGRFWTMSMVVGRVGHKKTSVDGF